MDNRFSTKDFVLLALILGLVIMIGASMYQEDRKWSQVQEMITLLKQQNDSLDQIVRGGIQIGGGAGPATSQEMLNDPTFARETVPHRQEDYSEGDFYIDAFSATVKTLTPLVSGDIYADRIQGYVLDTLLRMDLNSLKYEPWIAESWEISEDGLTFTFKLRNDVVFSDGEPLTANDVQFTYEWIMNPKVAAPRERSSMEKLAHVKALDDYTVEFKFREPYFRSLELCGSMDILAEHYYSQFTEDKFNESPGLMFGSGPYKMSVDPKKWTPGSQKIELVRNDNYWGPRAPLDRVIWREILEDTAMEAEFRNRGIDRLSVRPASYRKLSRDDDLRAKADLYEYEYVSSGYVYVGWNQRRNERPTAFADKRVRQAMTMLIDRDTIAKRVYDNLWTTATGPFHPLSWQVNKDIEPWPYDPERAKALLEQAGYIDRDGNGVRESPQGEPLTFELIHSIGSAEVDQMVLLMKDAMAKAGVELKPDPLEWPTMQQKLDDRGFDAIMLGWGGVVNTDVYQMFHSDQIDDGGDNYTYYLSDKVDDLIERARTTVDREEGAGLWRQVHETLHEDQPYTFMFNRKAVVYVDKRIENIQITPVGMNFAWEFYVPQAQQLHIER